jgi:hypothetical protein
MPLFRRLIARTRRASSLPHSLITACFTPFFILFLLFTPSPAHACTPPPHPPPTLAERFEAAEVVFSGRVIRTGGRVVGNTGLPRFYPIQEHELLGTRYDRFFDAEFVVAAMPYYALVEIDEYYKGSGIGEVAVMGFGYGRDCLNSAEAGDAFVFFTTGDSPLYALRYLYPHAGVMQYDRRSQRALAEEIGVSGTPPDTTRTTVWLPASVAAAALALVLLRSAGRVMRG